MRPVLTDATMGPLNFDSASIQVLHADLDAKSGTAMIQYGYNLAILRTSYGSHAVPLSSSKLLTGHTSLKTSMAQCSAVVYLPNACE